MIESTQDISPLPARRITVFEAGDHVSGAAWPCVLDHHVVFDTEKLESYFLARWDAAAFDALVVAAAVEFADRMQRRPAYGWGRDFDLDIPVHDPERWSQPPVAESLRDALEFLTGDQWRIQFRARHKPFDPLRFAPLPFSVPVRAVMPYSDGLDSRAVAALKGRELGTGLVRIRLGSKDLAGDAKNRRMEPFTSVPYGVHIEEDHQESSNRSRGFKFSLVTALAAFFAQTDTIILSESGQGALGPSLVPVAHAYEDYRSHPMFAQRMERFVFALLGHRVTYAFPRLWFTKAETLAVFKQECDPSPAAWIGTRSCWRQSRNVHADGKKRRQCGVCAACMLRRSSIYAADLEEPQSNYVFEDLGAPSMEQAAAEGALNDGKIPKSTREYAIAGTLHLDHLAGLLNSAANSAALAMRASQLSSCLDIPLDETTQKLQRMLRQHEAEWHGFVDSLGSGSFIRKWVDR